MLVNGDCQWITTLHYAFQDDSNLVRLYMSVLDEVTSLKLLSLCILQAYISFFREQCCVHLVAACTFSIVAAEVNGVKKH